MKKKLVLAGAVALALSAAPAAAQTCISTPASMLGAQNCLITPVGQKLTVFGGVDLPDGLKGYTVGAAAGLGQSFALSGSYTMLSPDGAGSSEGQFNFGTSLNFAGLFGAEGLFTGLVTGASYTGFDGGHFLNVPVGFAVSKSLPVGEGMAIAPYVQPQFVYYGTYIEGEDAITGNSFGASAGATFHFSRLSAGASMGKVFEDGAKAVFNVHVGFGF